MIDCEDDISDLSRRDLVALIEYFWNTYRVYIRCPSDLETRRAD